jgi:hypothetical protein
VWPPLRNLFVFTTLMTHGLFQNFHLQYCYVGHNIQLTSSGENVESQKLKSWCTGNAPSKFSIMLDISQNIWLLYDSSRFFPACSLSLLHNLYSHAQYPNGFFIITLMFHFIYLYIVHKWALHHHLVLLGLEFFQSY